MKKIAVINACTDLGVNVNGAELGPEILTNNLKSSCALQKYTIKINSNKDTKNLKEIKTDKKNIQDFFEEFNSLLLKMHDLHFEQNMPQENKAEYQKKMHSLVLAVKELDTKREKRNLNSINEFNEKLYNTTKKVIEQNEFPLTVGGDHIIAIASSLASIEKNKNMGIIWFDSHADFNTYNTSVTGNLHGLPLAVATNYEKEILSDFHTGPFYLPKNTVIVGGRDIDPWEWTNLLDAGVTVFSTQDINKYGIESICKKAFEIAGNNTNGIHVSFDLDLIDPKVAPGVSVPAENGISLEQTYELVKEISKYSSEIRSADLVEFNPNFDIEHRTEKIAKDILNLWIEEFSK